MQELLSELQKARVFLHDNLATWATGPQHEGRRRQAVHEPRLSDGLHPGPDEGDELAAPVETEIAMAEGAEGGLGVLAEGGDGRGAHVEIRLGPPVDGLATTLIRLT